MPVTKLESSEARNTAAVATSGSYERGRHLLNPFTGRVSQTIVALPLTNLQSGKYLVSVQNQTARQQFIDACTQLGQ